MADSRRKHSVVSSKLSKQNPFAAFNHILSGLNQLLSSKFFGEKTGGTR